MKNTIWVTLFFTLSFCSCSKPDTITPEEAVQAIRRFDEGWKNKKAGIVDSILAEKYIYFTQSGGVFDRGNLVKTAGSDEYKLVLMERTLVSVQVSGNTAVVNTTWKGKGSYYGNAFDDLQRCSVTLVKHDGKVEILAEHCTLIK